ncbi:MAG: nucleotide sugar dehydrogenase [Clostridia bacterium]
MNILIIGCGYVGLTTGCALAYLGHHVTLLDLDESKIASLRDGNVPFFERGIADVLGACREHLHVTTEWTALTGSTELIMIAVGTPSKENGQVDLTYVQQAAEQIGSCLEEGHSPLIVTKSTVPVGTSKLIQKQMEGQLKNRGMDQRVLVASNPEFLREGDALHDSLFPDRIVVGAECEEAFLILQELYKPILEQSFDPPPHIMKPAHYTRPLLVKTNRASAELIKYASNSFLATKISFINEFANLSEKVGADIHDVALGMGLDKRIGSQFLRAGIGWGGSCFGKDTRAILHTARQNHCHLLVVEAAVLANQKQRETVLRKLRLHVPQLSGCTVGLLGLAFKPETDDLRDAPSLEIIQQLTVEGVRLKVYDPVAMGNFKKSYPDLSAECCDSVEELFQNCDAVVLLTDWEEFRHLPYATLASSMKRQLIIDGRNVLNSCEMTEAGYCYVGIGRAESRRVDRVLVTGGAGFIGSHLVDRLLAEGAEVLVLDNFDSFYDRSVKERNMQGHFDHNLHRFIEADICNRDQLEAVFREWKPDYVVHLAAMAGVRPSVQNPMKYVETNVVGTTNLLDLSVAHGVKKFIFGSSSSVYGLNKKVPFCESDAISLPASPYAATKVTGEALCQSYQNCYGLPIVALRFFTVYGPRQRPDLAIHKFLLNIKNNEPISLFGDGTTSRDYTYVSDIVSGIWQALRYESTGYEVFNLGNDQPTQLLELVQTMEALIGKKAEINWLPMQTGDVPHTWADLSKSRSLLGYEPSVRLETGLANQLAWLMQAK